MASKALTFLIGADNRKSVKALNRFKKSVSSVAGSLAGALGVGLTIGAVTAFTKKLIDQGDQIGKLSKRYGLSTDALQKFKYMSEISGSSIEGVDKAIKTLVTSTGEANQGLKSYQRYFELLNVDYKKLKDLSPEEQFEVVAKKLGALSDKSQKVYLATKLFGRAGRELIPMLNEYNTLSAEAEKHIVFTPEDVKAAEAYKDSMTRLGLSMQRVVVDSGFLPWLADVADRLDQSIGLANKIEQAKKEGTSGALTNGWETAGRFLASSYSFGLSEKIGMGALGTREMISANAANYNKTDVSGIDPNDIKAIKEAVQGAKRY